MDSRRASRAKSSLQHSDFKSRICYLTTDLTAGSAPAVHTENAGKIKINLGMPLVDLYRFAAKAMFSVGPYLQESNVNNSSGLKKLRAISILPVIIS